MKKNWMSTKYLMVFFTVTLAWTWICGFIPVIFGFTETGAGTFIFYFGGGAPSVVALFLVFLTYPKDIRADYFRRCFSFKLAGWKWPLITIGVFTFLSAVSIVTGVFLLGFDMPTMDYIKAIAANPLNILLVLLISLISGPLNEEFGWRGYALDRLLIKFGFLRGSLILGFIWAIWHLPWYFTPGQAQYNLLKDSVFHAVMFIPSVMLLSVFVSFVYVKTNRSILAGALVHMFSNLIGSQLLSSYTTEISMLIRYTNMLFFLAVAVYTSCSREFKDETRELIESISSPDRYSGNTSQI
ncbi:MAG: CPBP family intramembrane metalloprotease [Lachnospiraceae bacterium]|nr:CPBP family intramembrane metalloprotease [Lachnospiraceae bacterium]